MMLLFYFDGNGSFVSIRLESTDLPNYVLNNT